MGEGAAQEHAGHHRDDIARMFSEGGEAHDGQKSADGGAVELPVDEEEVDHAEKAVDAGVHQPRPGAEHPQVVAGHPAGGAEKPEVVRPDLLAPLARGHEPQADEEQAALEDGTYTAEFKTDSSMFHVNEAMDGKGTLTVEDGKMTIHISLVSKNIVNLFEGTAEDAQKDGAELLQPTTDTINYSDGTSDEVYGFDVPVPALDKEFDLALIGKKGTWYDHKVSVTNPVEVEE